MATTPEFEMLQNNLKYKAHSSLTSIQDVGRSERSTPARSRSISRQTSVISIASLDLQMQESGSRPMSTLRDILSGETRNLRMGSILYLLLFSCLLFGTLSDVICRMKTGDARHHAKKHKSYDNDKKGILGSAMISSLTGALSPILPFAGGVDLRRDNAWKSWRNYLWIFGDGDASETMNSGEKVSLMPRGGGQTRNKGSSSTAMVLSLTDPFLPYEDIADMTLREISFTIKYVVESSMEEFDLDSFISQDYEGEPVNTRMENAVRSIEDAVQRSRGGDVLPALTFVENDLNNADVDAVYGDIDALHFCAAMRIFAEWRVLRQVPPGYKGYAVGMGLGQKDVVQNVAKIERAAHEWIASRTGVEECKDEEDNCPQRRSPTLRQLLVHEIDGNVHPNNRLPRLKDNTAAMGLLWVRRQLHYQSTIFDNIISVPIKFPTCIGAVSEAYSEVYGHVHGWAVQKIFNYSFQSAPDAKEIFRHMNPRLLEKVQNAAMASAAASNDGEEVADLTAVAANKIKFDSFKESRRNNIVNPFLDFFGNIGTEFDKFGKHFGGEWDKVVCNASNVFRKGDDKDCDDNMKISLNTRGGISITHISLNDEDIEEYTSKEMQKDAKEHIMVFLRTANPVLKDLAGLFDEMNMDDPTKV
jgi:hypothetical protein